MWFQIGKFLDPLTHPIGLVWLALALACLRSALKLRIKSVLFLGGLTAFLSLVGSTRWPATLLASLERPYVIPNLGALPEADVVVMLGGTHDASAGDALGLNLGEGGDRFLMAAELMRMGKGRILLLGGSDATVDGRLVPEAELLQRWVTTWRPFSQPVEHLGICANTREEAERVAQRARERGWKRVILVTSGYHMRRAEAVFLEVGVPVIPVGCDFKGLGYLNKRRPFTLFPEHYGFDHLRLYLHEQVGWYYYRARGWARGADVEKK